MLREERATSSRFDATKGEFVVEIGGAAGGTTTAEELNLLVDAKGHLVGIDLGGEGIGRTVVMLGRHEDVADQRPARGAVTRSPGGVARVTVFDAAKVIEVGARNPYV